MKKTTIILLIITTIIITGIYTVYNIYIRLEKKKQSSTDIKQKEKVISKDLRIGITNFDTINPIISNNSNLQNISRLIFEPLINLSYNYKLEPCLAKEWNKVDKNTYLIKLRENVKWQDGKSFDSNDVIFTVNIIRNLKEKSIYFYNIKDIKEINKIDEYTIKIITEDEIPYFEYNLIFPIMSSKYYTEESFTEKKKNIRPIGTGLYYISDYNNENITLKLNSAWWKKEDSKIDNITINLYDNINKATQDIEISNIDLLTTSLKDIDNYVDETKCNTKTFIGRNYHYIVLNLKYNILKNKKIRQAISYAINKDDIINNVYNKKYMKSEFPLDFGSYLYNKNLEKIEYNKSKAEEILKECNIKNINLKLLVKSNNEDRIKVANIIKQQLEDIGIKVTIIEKSEKQYKEDLKNKNFDLCLAENTYSFSPSLNSYFEDNNLSGYKNNEIIKILRRIENKSEEDSKKSIEEIIKYYNEDVPYISLYYDTNTIIYSRNLKGEITPNSYNIFYNIENWYREYDK